MEKTKKQMQAYSLGLTTVELARRTGKSSCFWSLYLRDQVTSAPADVEFKKIIKELQKP